ncbi:MAG: DUF4339 domain-containing protein [Muribaculaceae bacterium]|nr:DUF4339 domain-containing protein [Muribaculaceae bacterium]
MEFFIIKNDEQHGPFNLSQMSVVNLQPDTPVWHEGLEDWTPASEVAELKDLVAYAPKVDAATEAQTLAGTGNGVPPMWKHNANDAIETPVVNNDKPIEKTEAKPRKSHTGLWVTLAITALVAVILAVTNPKKDDHCREIASVSSTWMNETIDGFDMNNLIGGAVKILSSKLIRNVVDDYVDVDNYGLFSIGYIDTGTEKTRVSLGILGNVFTFNKEQLDEKIKEIMSKYIEDAVGLGSFFTQTIDSSDSIIEGLIRMVGGNLFSENTQNEAVVPEEDEIDSTERAESTYTTPSMGEQILKEGAKMAIKKGADFLIDKVDDMGKE